MGLFDDKKLDMPSDPTEGRDLVPDLDGLKCYLADNAKADFVLTTRTKVHAYKVDRKTGRSGDIMQFVKAATDHGRYVYIGSVFPRDNNFRYTKKSQMTASDSAFRLFQAFWEALSEDPRELAKSIKDGEIKVHTAA